MFVMESKGWFKCELGLIFWEEARKAVEHIRFHGGDIQHFESSGLVDREFTFRGDEQSVNSMYDYLVELTRV